MMLFGICARGRFFCGLARRCRWVLVPVGVRLGWHISRFCSVVAAGRLSSFNLFFRSKAWCQIRSSNSHHISSAVSVEFSAEYDPICRQNKRDDNKDPLQTNQFVQYWSNWKNITWSSILIPIDPRWTPSRLSMKAPMSVQYPAYLVVGVLS